MPHGLLVAHLYDVVEEPQITCARARVLNTCMSSCDPHVLRSTLSFI